MSIQAMAWVLDNDRHTANGQRLVLLSIANHVNGDSATAYPSHQLIADETQMHHQTVKKLIRKMQDVGLLHVVPNGAPDTRIPVDRRPNLYTILPLHKYGPGVIWTSGPGGTNHTPRAVAGGTNGHERGVQNAPSGGYQTHPQSVNNHKEPLGSDTDPPRLLSREDRNANLANLREAQDRLAAAGAKAAAATDDSPDPWNDRKDLR